MFVCGFVERDWTETMAALIEACDARTLKISSLEAASKDDDMRYTTMGARVLSISRMKEGDSNAGLGGDDCPCFPSLKARLRQKEEESSDSEFEFPGLLDSDSD